MVDFWRVDKGVVIFNPISLYFVKCIGMNNGEELMDKLYFQFTRSMSIRDKVDALQHIVCNCQEMIDKLVDKYETITGDDNNGRT